MKNIQHSTFNIQHRITASARPPWALSVGCWLLNVPKSILVFAIRLYRWTISPMQTVLFGPTAACRFTPTCSEYAMEAVREHGALTGSRLAAKRICRCHPWGGCGHDPVPEPENKKAENKMVWGNIH